MTKVVTAAVFWKGARVLLARRAPGEDHAGWWELPGGKVESGESEPQALARELREEFGTECKIGGLLAQSHFTYPKGEILLRAYEAQGDTAEFELRVHDQIRWIDPGTGDTDQILPADVPILKALAQSCTAD